MKTIAWSCVVLALTGIILAAVYFLQPGFDFNRWDNYEYFTPIIEYSQSCWLKGEIPYWNPHQMMGEPIVATGQAGPFYLPYFLSVLILKLFHLSPGNLCFIIVALHVPFAALGWFLLLSRLYVRRSLCILIALSISFGGFITLISMVWIFMMPVFAFLSWILLGLILILKDERKILGSVVFIIALTGEAYIGHPQMTAYSWFFAFLYMLVFLFFIFRDTSNYLHLLFCFITAGLLSLPPLLPAFCAVQYSPRNVKFTRSQFVERGLEFDKLAGVLLPHYKIKPCSLGTPSSMMAYQGAWLIPGFAGGVLMALVQRIRKNQNHTIQRNTKNKNTPQNRSEVLLTEKISLDSTDAREISLLKKMFFFSFFPALLLLLFALGRDGFIYGWTYGIPIWSSFRWPIKFCCYCFPSLALSAGLGLELWARFLHGRPVVSLRRFCIGPLLCWLAWLWLLFYSAKNTTLPFEWLSLISGLACLGIIGWIDRRGARTLLSILCICNIIAFQYLCHGVYYKRYKEPYASVGPAQLHINNAWRVIPITVREINNQWLGLSDSATANGYYSFAGIPFGLVPSWYQFPIPMNLVGFPFDSKAACRQLNTNLMDSFNVRYIFVSPQDRQTISVLHNMGKFTPVFANDKVMVLDNPSALPRAYFASDLFAFNELGFQEGMINNKTPATSAFIEDYAGPRNIPVGTVNSVRESSSHIDVEILSPQGGFLVLSETYYPDWTVAIDGKQAKLCRVNKRAMGVQVPVGAKAASFQYHSAELKWGCVGAIIGMGLLIGRIIRKEPKKIVSIAQDMRAKDQST